MSSKQPKSSMKKLTQASHVLKNGYFCEAAVAQGLVDIAKTKMKHVMELT